LDKTRTRISADIFLGKEGAAVAKGPGDVSVVDESFMTVGGEMRMDYIINPINFNSLTSQCDVLYAGNSSKPAHRCCNI
jgi:hypothetical protein